MFQISVAIDLLLDGGHDINAQNKDDENPLLVALKKCLLDPLLVFKAKHLISRGANLNAVAKEGNAIHYTIKGGNIGNTSKNISS